MCGLQAGASDDTSAWLPVAAAMKLDHAEFERRVVAALPRIVRRGLDQAAAERIAQVLQAMQVDARVLPDDPQLVYINQAGATRGPLPQSSLGDFIQLGESYRLRGKQAWLPWPTPVDQEVAATATPTVVALDHSDDPASSPAPGDELIDAMPTLDATDDASDAAADELATGSDDELPPVMPPPLPTPPTTQQQPTLATSGDSEAAEPDSNAAESARDDEFIDLADTAATPADPDASDTTMAETAETAAPARFRTGRLIVLLAIVALAVWAYRHWTADTRADGAPAAAAAIQPSRTATGQPATPAPAASADDTTATSASAPSVAASASAPAPANTAATPATATSTPAPPEAHSLPAAASTTATSAMAVRAPAPATSSGNAITASVESFGRLPASAGTILPARAAPATATPVTASVPSAH